MAPVDLRGEEYALTPGMVMWVAMAAMDDRRTVWERVASAEMLREWASMAGARDARELIRGAVAVVVGRKVGDA